MRYSLASSHDSCKLVVMESRNTAYCRTCQGTNWHNGALCFACELTVAQAAEVVVQRARMGLSTPDEAASALNMFEATLRQNTASKPACFERYDAPQGTDDQLNQMQRSLRDEARALGVAL